MACDKGRRALNRGEKAAICVDVNAGRHKKSLFAARYCDFLSGPVHSEIERVSIDSEELVDDAFVAAMSSIDGASECIQAKVQVLRDLERLTSIQKASNQ
jgi:hypothetical protein